MTAWIIAAAVLVSLVYVAFNVDDCETRTCPTPTMSPMWVKPWGTLAPAECICVERPR